MTQPPGLGPRHQLSGFARKAWGLFSVRRILSHIRDSESNHLCPESPLVTGIRVLLREERFLPPYRDERNPSFPLAGSHGRAVRPARCLRAVWTYDCRM